jgi:hypothetical protein
MRTAWTEKRVIPGDMMGDLVWDVVRMKRKPTLTLWEL